MNYMYLAVTNRVLTTVVRGGNRLDVGFRYIDGSSFIALGLYENTVIFCHEISRF